MKLVFVELGGAESAEIDALRRFTYNILSPRVRLPNRLKISMLLMSFITYNII